MAQLVVIVMWPSERPPPDATCSLACSATKSSATQNAQSFKAQGVLQPLVVRSKNGDANKFEVVAGARRLRAAQLAELKAVPVRVVELSDSDAVLAQVTENMQREGIHPLEEAFGFRSLLNLNDPNYTIATLAAKAGKSEAYVQGRIKLTELIAPIADAFLADKITIGHALLIAKLPAGQQQTAFNACFHQIWTGEGNTATLIPVRELALCGAPHNASNAECLFMQSAAA
jgi:ParB family transcriptional regulator, chromosome partitioning protein